MNKLLKGLIIFLILWGIVGGYYAYKYIADWFDPDNGNSGRSAELGEKVVADIAGIQDGIAVGEGRAERIESGIDWAAERAERLAEQRREMEARRKRIEERVAGLKTASDKIEAGLELGEAALRRLRDIIQRLQEGDGEELEPVEILE